MLSYLAFFFLLKLLVLRHNSLANTLGILELSIYLLLHFQYVEPRKRQMPVLVINNEIKCFKNDYEKKRNQLYKYFQKHRKAVCGKTPNLSYVTMLPE